MAKKKNKLKPLKLKTPGEVDAEVSATLSTLSQPVLMKMCRLCEAKDGPFLNIFDADKVTAKKIEDLMPFVIAENDDLPHKICFRCSAKLEELHEFIQKCCKTQENLSCTLGKKRPLIPKAKTHFKSLWEDKLNKSNITNDDICDAVIKKAMEGIKDIPIPSNLIPPEKEKPIEDSITPSKKPTETGKKIVMDSALKGTVEKSLKIPKSKVEIMKKNNFDISLPAKTPDECDLKLSHATPTRSSRSKNTEPLLEGLEDIPKIKKNVKKPLKKVNVTPSSTETAMTRGINNAVSTKELSFDYEDEKDKPMKSITPNKEKQSPEKEAKPFNIMDHVSIIKVNGVGVLFQCKLCNRNFLKREFVETHGCAKNRVPKVEFPKSMVPPEPPKGPTVKYITTKIDKDPKKLQPSESVGDKTQIALSSMDRNLEKKNRAPESKAKPRIGPASKVKRDTDKTNPTIGMVVSPREPTPPSDPPAVPLVQFPTIPSLNSRYKLVPGPNNTLYLVEDQAAQKQETTHKAPTDLIIKKRKSTIDVSDMIIGPKSKKERKQNNSSDTSNSKPIQEHSNEQPYPVGLFKTGQHSNIFPIPKNPEPAPFFASVLKKQSYTVVQTENPSKLLISAKPEAALKEVIVKKKSKKKGPKPVQEESEVSLRGSYIQKIHINTEHPASGSTKCSE